MMSCSSLSPDSVHYLSNDWHDSQSYPGVRFATKRISLGGRLALIEGLRDLFQRYEFLRAGDAMENTEATHADLLSQRLYMEWGLADLQGLTINGSQATVEMLIERGPEALCNEIVAAIRSSLELSEQETKNS